MDTFQFLTKILPRQGLYVLAVFPGDSPEHKGSLPNHTVHDTVESLAAAANNKDLAGRAVYHARASFAERMPPNSGMRTKENVLYVRSLAVDLDVGPSKPYQSPDEALAALSFTCSQISLPAPLTVSSGRGVHAYWVWDCDVPKDDAQVLHDAVTRAAKQHNLRIDISVTPNMSSLLRPVGTHWRKDGARKVDIISDADEVGVDVMRAALNPFIQVVTVPAVLRDEWSTGPRTFPPSSMAQLTKHCRAARTEAKDTSEELWRDLLGLIKHTSEGAEWAHRWSEKDTDRYTEADTDKKLAGWTAGPPTCETIKKHGACGDCALAVKSPIHLGYTEVASSAPAFVAPALPPAADVDPSKLDHSQVPFWPSIYGWNGYAIEKMIKVENDDGTTRDEPEAFSTRWWYPYARTRLHTGAMSLRICARGIRGTWDEFDMPTSAVADERTLLKILAEHEIFALGKKGTFMTAQYIRDMMVAIETHAIETQTISSFGWHDDGFVVGNTMVTATGERPVLLSDRVPVALAANMGCKGTPQEWVRLVDFLYNRPGAEICQFAVCHALASPLIELVSSDLFHGIPLALVGESGIGKTTLALVGASIFGNPKAFSIQANEGGTTLNALLALVAAFRNLPIVLDELHGMKNADLPNLLYALSNGRPKNALRSDRTFANDGSTWNMSPFVTSNEDLIDKLSEHDRAKSEATQVRVFQIKVPDGFTSLFADINAKDVIDNQLLANQYGTVGRLYLTSVCKNRDKIVAAIQRRRAALGIGDADASKERFQLDTRALALVAGAIAKSLGLIKWDLEAMDAVAAKAMVEMRRTRASSAPDFATDLQRVLSALVASTVQTKTFPRLVSGKSITIEHVEWRHRSTPVARQPLDSDVLIVTKPGLRDICKDLRVPPNPFIDNCEKSGLFLSPAWTGVNDPGGRIYPFRGTDLPNAAAQIHCFIIDLAVLGGIGNTSNKKIVKLVSKLSGVK